MKKVFLIFCLTLICAACAHPKHANDASGTTATDSKTTTTPFASHSGNPPNDYQAALPTDGGAPEQLNPKEILDAMRAIRSDVEACNTGGIRDTVKIEFKIMSDGSIESATAVDAYANTDIGNCIATCVSKTKFRATGAVINITFPFKFQ